MGRVDCPFCGVLGRVSSERVITGDAALTTYFCDACHTEWDERADRMPASPRTREPKTHKDKTGGS